MIHVLRIGLIAAVLASAAFVAPADWWPLQWLFGKPDAATVAAGNLKSALTPARINAELKSALDGGDKHLAESFVELARQETIAIDPALRQRYDSEVSGIINKVEEVAWGVWEGKCTSTSAFVGTQIGNGLSFGDMRDLYDQAANYRNGRETDKLVIGLAAVGVLSTAAVPFHAATSMIKGLAKANRLSPLFKRELTEALAVGLDTEAILKAVPQLSFWESLPGIGWEGWLPDFSWPFVTDKLPQLVSAIGSGVQLGKLGAFNQLAGNVVSLASNTGICGAQDALALAQSAADLDRLARVSDRYKLATVAILKLLGHDAVLLPDQG